MPVNDPLDSRALTIAAEAGDAEAAYRLSVLTAVGLGVVQDWRTATDWLEKAAAGGHHRALVDHGLLADDTGKIDLDRWLTPAGLRSISGSPAIVGMDEFIPPVMCRELRDRAAPRTKRAEVFDTTTGSSRQEVGRSNSTTQFTGTDMDFLTAVVRHRIANAAGVPAACLEWTHMLHYSVGQSFDWHVDYLDPAQPGFALDVQRRGQRIATCLIYLNDDFEGGETAFSAGDLRHRGRTGDALMWSNTLDDGSIDPRTAHAGLPPTRGEKWVLSQWMRNRMQY